jgi:hypothetical protein
MCFLSSGLNVQKTHKFLLVRDAIELYSSDQPTTQACFLMYLHSLFHDLIFITWLQIGKSILFAHLCPGCSIFPRHFIFLEHAVQVTKPSDPTFVKVKSLVSHMIFQLFNHLILTS